MPLGTEVLGVRVVTPPKGVTGRPTIVAQGKFDIATKLTVNRSFRIVEDGEPFIENLQYVGTLSFTDKAGAKFVHVCVDRDKPAIVTSEELVPANNPINIKDVLKRIPRPGVT